MFGLPPAAVRHELFDRVLPDVARRWRPDVPYVAHAPDGPGWSFAPDRGIAHYYGVGAYLRGLDDARRANVRFAAECLGFANVPDQRTLAALGTGDAHDPRWKAASPRDPGAAWDFDDVRDHYLTTLFNENAAALRMRDRDRYLDLSRAVAIEVMQAVFAEWRRPGSCCAGGIVWTLNDVVPGAGWGVLDAAARPKPAWHGLRGVLQPVQLLLIDEGLNGLDVHVLNETAAPRQLDLELCCLRADGVAVARSTARLEVPARGARTLRSADLFDGFFDITAAYHFGPPAHEVTWATLRDAGGELVSTAAHFPSGPQLAPRDPGFSVRVGQDDAGWWLEIGAERFAQHVHIVADQFRAAPDWFHLPPGGARLVRLLRECEAEIVPEGYILALNAFAWKSFSGRK